MEDFSNYFASELCSNMLFDREKDAEDFDKYLEEYCKNPKAINEFLLALENYNSPGEIDYAINIERDFQDNLEGKYSKRLLELCENMTAGRQIEDDDCYSQAINYIYRYIRINKLQYI